MRNKPFSLSYDWRDFNNYKKLTSYQKHKIKKEYALVVEGIIQDIINQSIEDRADRREELNSHQNPNDHFRLDIGGEG